MLWVSNFHTVVLHRKLEPPFSSEEPSSEVETNPVSYLHTMKNIKVSIFLWLGITEQNRVVKQCVERSRFSLNRDSSFSSLFSLFFSFSHSLLLNGYALFIFILLSLWIWSRLLNRVLCKLFVSNCSYYYDFEWD